MNFETTTCISKENLEVIEYYAEKYSIKPTTLIVSLLRYVADKNRLPVIASRRIRYRKRDGNGSWERIHVMLTPFDYELFLDMKKLGKMSLAKIIDFCMEN